MSIFRRIQKIICFPCFTDRCCFKESVSFKICSNSFLTSWNKHIRPYFHRHHIFIQNCHHSSRSSRSCKGKTLRHLSFRPEASVQVNLSICIHQNSRIILKIIILPGSEHSSIFIMNISIILIFSSRCIADSYSDYPGKIKGIIEIIPSIRSFLHIRSKKPAVFCIR